MLYIDVLLHRVIDLNKNLNNITWFWCSKQTRFFQKRFYKLASSKLWVVMRCDVMLRKKNVMIRKKKRDASPFLQSNFKSCKFILRIGKKSTSCKLLFTSCKVCFTKILKIYFTSCQFLFTSWKFKMINLRVESLEW